MLVEISWQMKIKSDLWFACNLFTLLLWIQCMPGSLIRTSLILYLHVSLLEGGCTPKTTKLK